MHAVGLPPDADLAAWRPAARVLLASAVPPDAVSWHGDDLFAATPPPPTAAGAAVNVPRAFLSLAELVIRHRSTERFALLYRLLWRLSHGERELLAIRVDPDVARAAVLAKQVTRDAYAMKAYLRFRETADGCFLAWFEPEHYTLELAAPHFTKRFAVLRWSILTPDRSAHWDGEQLTFAAGARKAAVPDGDALEAHWRTYYAAVFNPARLNTAAMLRQMPRKYWRNLPETEIIAPLTRGAAARAQAMITAEPTLPSRRGRTAPARVAAAPADPRSIAELRQALGACRACPLWEMATQAVASEGPADAALMLVGEQPGDTEDLAGRPFVGPAGQVLDRAMAEAGLVREAVYITGAVKHFKFVPRGKKRIHQRPSARDVEACRGWLDREVDLVKPALIVALGATAARALLGYDVAVMEQRGRVIEDAGRRVLLSLHPASVLRLPDEAARQAQYRALVEDLKSARAIVR